MICLRYRIRVLLINLRRKNNMNLRIIVMGLMVSLQGCGFVDDFVFGKDNTLHPAKLPVVEHPHNPKVVWKTAIGHFDKSSITPDLQPVLYQGVLYVAAADGRVLAIQQNTGHVLWEKKLGLKLLAGPVVNGQHLVVNSDKSSLLVLDQASGKQEKTIALSSDSLAAPLISGGALYVKTINGYLYKIDIASGKKLWSYHEAAPDLILKASSSPIAYKNTIIAGFSDGALVAFDSSNGHVIWQRHLAFPKGASDVERLVDIDTNPVIEDSHLYLATYQGVVGSYAIDSEEMLWERNASTYHDLAMTDGYLAMVDSHDVIWLLDKSNGNVIWKQTALKGRGLGAPFFWNNELWLADHSGVLHGLALKTGRFVSQLPMAAPIVSKPLVNGDFCFVLNTDGNLYRLSMRK